MNTIYKALIVGDTHGVRENVEKAIEVAKQRDCDAIIQVGDFGYWPEQVPEMLQGYEIPVYFIDGNHEFFGNENVPGLTKYTKPVTEIAPNLFYVKRGTKIRIRNCNCLFLGGAYSIDRSVRVLGDSWFEEETISGYELGVALGHTNVNVVFSHDAPKSMNLGVSPIGDSDSNREKLEQVLAQYSPENWFFGHYHGEYRKFDYGRGCELVGLNKACESGSMVVFNFHTCQIED
jgi:hypothetical protein